MTLLVAIGLSLIMHLANVLLGASIPMWIVLAPTVVTLVFITLALIIVGVYTWYVNKCIKEGENKNDN